MHYISKVNDNLFTIAQFLMRQLYYLPQRDESIKFFYYDTFDRKVKLLDLKDSTSVLGVYPTILSMFKTNNESLIQQEPTTLGSFNSPT